MSMAEKTIRLQLWNQSCVRLRTVQGEDSSRTITAELIEGDGSAADLSGYTASVYILGKGGQKLTQPAEIAGNAVTAAIPYIGFSGEADVQICLAKSESEMLKVTGLTLDVLPSDLEGAAEGSDEFNDLAALIGQAADAIAAANAAAEAASQTAADIEERADSGEFDGASGTIDTATASPLTGLLKGNGTTVETAVPGTDYLSPAGGTVAGDLEVEGELSAGGSALADFVVEQGTSGYWTYRKWKSGTAEGWFRNSYASLSFGDETGSGALFQYARYNLTLALPTSAAVFVESPRTVLAAASRGTSVYPFGAFVNTRSSTTVNVVLWSAIGGALPNVSVELYAVGRWK